MIKVKLVTSDGGYVATVEIPVFNRYPDVLLWGQRFFVPKNLPVHDSVGWPVYQEAFFFAAVVTVPEPTP